jgi:hypothetical protein
LPVPAAAVEDNGRSPGAIADDWALIGSAGEDQGSSSSSAAPQPAFFLPHGSTIIKPPAKPPPKVPGGGTGGTGGDAAAAAGAIDPFPQRYTLEVLAAAGVPTVEERACVLLLAQRLGCVPGQVEPLCDPLTLLR